MEGQPKPLQTDARPEDRNRSARFFPKLAQRLKPRRQGDKPSTNPTVNVTNVANIAVSQPAHNGGPANPCPADQLQHPVRSKLADTWLRAVQWLCEEKKAKLLDEYESILGLELNVDLKSVGSLNQHKELVRLLEMNTKELESKKLSLLLACPPGFEDRVYRVLDDILITKDLISSGVSAANLFAGIACAGVAVILTLFIQSTNQQKSLFEGIEHAAALIRRLVLIDVYQIQSANSSQTTPIIVFSQDFERCLETLCAKVIEFLACAICFLWKRRVSRHVRNAFKLDDWDGLLRDIKDGEKVVEQHTTEISALRLEFLEDIMSKQQSEKRHELNHREERVKKFLQRLYSGTCHYRGRKDRNVERVPGTCESFASHPRFVQWSESAEASILLVSAEPGAGKSVLAKHLIDNILSSTATTTVCYFFFKEDFVDQTHATNALCAILRQIFLAKPHLVHDSLLTKVEYDGDKFISSFGDLWSVFVGVITDQNSGQFVFVLDALDECHDSHLSQLIKSIGDLYKLPSGTHKHKFLMTSRPYPHVKNRFHLLPENIPTIHLGHVKGEEQHEADKMAAEIDLVIKHRVEEISRHRHLKPSDQEFLQKRVMNGIKRSQRTYLWVTLVLDVIKNTPGLTKGAVRKHLRKIPQWVDEAYEKILQQSPDPEKAKTILSILTAATRPLSVEEMSVMIATAESHRVNESIKDHLDPNFRETIRKICGLFVVIIDAKVYLLHQTAREFLLAGTRTDISARVSDRWPQVWKHSLVPNTSHKLLANVCIWYILIPEEARPRGFEDYSSANWVVHFRKAEREGVTDILESARSLCDPASDLYQMWAWNHPHSPNMITSLMTASYFGLTTVVKLLLLAGRVPVDASDGIGWTALRMASEKGHSAVVELLLAADAQADTHDSIGWTALHSAAAYGHDGVVALLLAVDAPVDARDMSGWTALHQAAAYGHDAAVRLLLAAGAQVEASTRGGLTALQLAATNGHDAVVKLLLFSGALVDASSSDGSALYRASKKGYHAVVELLLAAGAKADSSNGDGPMPNAHLQSTRPP